MNGQYPFTTVIPNLGVWIPPEKDYGDQTSSGGAGSEGLALCVSSRICAVFFIAIHSFASFVFLSRRMSLVSLRELLKALVWDMPFSGTLKDAT